MKGIRRKYLEIHREIKTVPAAPVQFPEKSAIRLKAEELLKEKQPLPLSIRSLEMQRPISLSDEETQKLIYELEVHQIELEIQNEELRMAKEQLETLADKYTDLYDFAPAGYFTLSRDGVILGLNLHGSSMLSSERSSLINSRFGFFVPDDCKPEFNRFFETLFTSKSKATCYLSLVPHNNLPIGVQLSGSVANDHEQCHIAAIDISDKIRGEEEIKRKNSELQKVNAEKDKFFSIIAHDLRSPFNGFLGLTEIMSEGLNGMTPEEIVKIVRLLKNSATNLSHLLENLLEWSKMERGLISFNPGLFTLREVIDESLVLILESAKEKSIAIDLAMPDNLAVYVDKNMIESVFRNLVFNSVKFTPAGGRILVSAKKLADQCIVVSIRDNGIGMDKYILDNLFRLDKNTGRKGTNGELSTGLGLIICRDFIEMHGGKLWAESEEGNGSVFKFTLPGKKIS